MLSIFPDLYTYQQFVPLLLRIVAGLIFISFAYAKLISNRSNRIAFFHSIGLRPARLFWGITSLAELIGGIFLLVGFLLQPTALILAMISIIAAFIKMRRPTELTNSAGYFVLLFVMLVSLAFLGPGVFAVDFPL